MTFEEAQLHCRKVANDLGEHFEHVQLLISWNEESETRMYAIGTGNWYARQGMAHEFIVRNNADNIAQSIKETT